MQDYILLCTLQQKVFHNLLQTLTNGQRNHKRILLRIMTKVKECLIVNLRGLTTAAKTKFLTLSKT